MKNLSLLLCVCCLAVLMSACKGGPVKPQFEGIADIGSVSTPGVMEYDAATDTYTISAAGLNLWAKTDAASIVWMKVKGDFAITGDIDFVGEGVNPHRKLGFMIREDLSADCAYADIAIHGDGLTSLQFRKNRGEDTFETGSVEPGKSADFLITDGDPLQSFETIRTPYMVVMRGKPFLHPKAKRYAKTDAVLDDYMP